MLDRALMPLSDTVVAVSQGQAEYLRDEMGIPPERITVIYNGIDASAFGERKEGQERSGALRALGVPAESPVVVIVAALRPEKNHELLLNALSLCRCDFPPNLLIIGEGVEESRLRLAVQSKGLTERVFWLGLRSDIPHLLSLADVLVLSSSPVVETFPLCVLEAMAASLPVISTRVGSLGEMVVEGESGFLTPPGDAEALARALETVLNSPERALAMGVAGRQRVLRNFNRRSMVEKTARLLRKIAKA